MVIGTFCPSPARCKVLARGTIALATALPAGARPAIGVPLRIGDASSITPDPGPGSNTAAATSSVVTCAITGAGDITGIEGNDVICGSAGPDRIAGLGGNDVIFGLGCNDQITAGDGNDVPLGGDGSDQLVGGTGNDRLFGGGGGIDRLSGGIGDDTLNTVDGTTDDFLVGGEHVAGDTCTVDPGDSTAQCEGGVVTI